MRTALAVLALCLAAPAAAAPKCPDCACVAYLGSLRPRPDPTDVALNGLVRVTRQSARPGGGPPRIVLRVRGGAEVATEERSLRIDGVDSLELVPRAGLAAGTDHEVVMLRDGFTVELARFRTGDGRDTTPPTWTGIKEARFRPADGCAVSCQERRDARVEIVTDPPVDDRSADGLLAVWLARDGEPLAYDRPPAAHLSVARPEPGLALPGAPPPDVTLLLGGDGPCLGGTVALPRGARRLRIGMKALDRAGNAGPPSEAVVDLRRR